MTIKVNITASITRPSKVYNTETKKQCQHPDCSTRLSMYNSTNYCCTHERYHYRYVYKD